MGFKQTIERLGFKKKKNVIPNKNTIQVYNTFDAKFSNRHKQIPLYVHIKLKSHDFKSIL